MVKDLHEQYNFEVWTQPGSNLGLSPASSCTLAPMDRAQSTELHEDAVSTDPNSFELETAGEAKVSEKETAEQWKKYAALSPEQ